MITKERLARIKRNPNEVAALIYAHNDAGNINFVLENLGRLPSDFNADFLYKLLDHNHSAVRLNAVKNIGKLNKKLNADALSLLVFENDSDTKDRLFGAAR
ncbi:MAG: hypothetical protein LBU73_09975 [Helicobacteraceae bacterium]|jgi:hypothetical protein|nr:hypothetical protein [Helicobacteraceae bacterium]